MKTIVPDWEILMDVMKGKAIKAQLHDYSKVIEDIEKSLPENPKDYERYLNEREQLK